MDVRQIIGRARESYKLVRACMEASVETRITFDARRALEAARVLSAIGVVRVPGNPIQREHYGGDAPKKSALGEKMLLSLYSS